MKRVRVLLAVLLLTASPSIFAVSPEQVFRFATSNYPSLFSGTPVAGQYQQYNFRYFPASGNYLAVNIAGQIFITGSYTGGRITAVGSAAGFEQAINKWESLSLPARRFQPTNCHALVQAMLQKFESNKWVDVIAAQGWEPVASCPSTNPYKPWAFASLPTGTVTRWHVYAPGVWDFYTTEETLEEVWEPGIFPRVTPDAPMLAGSYSEVATRARDSVLLQQPEIATNFEMKYLFENGVPDQNQSLVKEAANNFLKHFADVISYSARPLGIVAYSSLAGGQALARSWDSANTVFLDDIARTFSHQIDPAKYTCLGMGGFSVGYERLIVLGAPCYNASSNGMNVVTHELTHEVQASLNNGKNPRNFAPVWLVEGQPQVVGVTMAAPDDKTRWLYLRQFWKKDIKPQRTLASMTAMEGETSASTEADVPLSEYNAGAGLSEYLIARSGLAKSLQVLQVSRRTGNANVMDGFRQAFQIVYGQSLDDFYAEALPYVNYLASVK